MEMVKRGESVQSFELKVIGRDGSSRDVSVDIVAIRKDGDGGHRILHFLDERSAKGGDGDGAGNGPEVRGSYTNGDDSLTPREFEVLRALAGGTPTRGIAVDLGISSVTVRNHVQRILGKLRVHSRLEAVALAYRTNLIDHEDLSA